MVFVLVAVMLAACGVTPGPTPPAPASTAAPPAPLAPPTAVSEGKSRPLAVLPSSRRREGEAAAPIIVRGASLAVPVLPPRAAIGAAGTASGDVTLNFAGADIRDVIAAVLGETLKLNYVIDPDVTGPVTFKIARPLPHNEILPAFEAVLASRGVTLVQQDGVVRVMRAQSNGKPQVALPIGPAPPGAVGERIELFPVRYVTVADIRNVLDKLLPPGDVILADEARRLVMVKGTAGELALAEDAVRVFDVDRMQGVSVALLPLQNAEAATVVVELSNIFDATRKEAATDLIRFLPVERLNAVMVLTREPQYLDEARAWVARLDRTRNMNERRVYVYYLQYGKAAQVAQTLQGALTGINVEVKGPSTANPMGIGDTESESLPIPPPAPGFPTPPPLLGTPAPVAAPAPAAPSPEAAAQPSVRIVADDAHNALLISATPRDYALIRDVLQGIDTPPLQVLIEVTVAEVTLNNSLRYGVQYFLNSRGTAGGNVSALLTTGNTAAGITPATPGFALSFTAANLEPRVVLQALSELTQTKVISTPRLLVLDNQTARLQVGDVVPIITQTAASTLTSSPLVLSNVQYKETGIVLSVTPRVSAGGMVTMDINQSVIDVVPTTSSTLNSPTFEQRRLTSTVSVKSAHSILLGGLIEDQDNRDSSGIPFLNEIPVIGGLFGNRNNSATRTELILFLTPYVLSNDTEATDATDRVMRRLRAVFDRSTFPPLRVPPP
ncbi:MAG TPA: type II secretion system secretin GspD [Stellaceae bacterium]|nr:type II secretion system secretin GspD [Stellaceae bacterium]